ncbi:MAG TPA: SGNH/GDSL hydrolase family protein [Burkholderiaceae bacterium]|nr:SGNH/GDSL hydrolase family protein [Burkholderiaceae bacterium]
MRDSIGRAVALPIAPLLIWQGRRVRRVVPRLPEAEGPREGTVGEARDGRALRLLILGDSSAAGVGVATQDDALAGRLLALLGARRPGPVRWRLVARTGIDTGEALALLEAAPPEPFDVAVIALGVNDTTAMKASARWLAEVSRLARTLHERHRVRALLWSGLPPMHRFPALPQPLRGVVGLHARALDAALARWCAGRGDAPPRSTHVPLPPMTDRSMVAADGFHPGAAAYALWAEALAPRVLEAARPAA